jgi:hypothetical protein
LIDPVGTIYWQRKKSPNSVNDLVVWSVVCKPKCVGGLGIINLEIQNNALLLKQLHKIYNKEIIPWVNLVLSLYGPGALHAQSSRGSFWCKDIFSFTSDYRSITHNNISDGSLTLWKDFWLNGDLLCDKYPRLFSYAMKEDVTVANIVSVPARISMFAFPMSVEAFHKV